MNIRKLLPILALTRVIYLPALAIFLTCLSVASAATSTWNVASGNWSNQFNWNPTGDPNNSSYDVIFNNGGSLMLDGGRNVNTYSQTGGIFTGPNGQSLRLYTSGTLDGGGIMNLGYSYIYQNVAGVLFTVTNGTIQGYGEIGYSGMSLLNQANGIISANTAGQTLSLNSTGIFTNNGLMRAINGGQLLFNGSADVINNSTIRSENSSTVRIQTRIVGGTLDNTGSTGLITINNGTLRDVTIASGSAVTNVDHTHLENSLINHGTLSPTNGQSILLTGNTTLSGGGTVSLGYGYVYADVGNLTLTNTNNIVRGYGQIGFNANNFSFINESGGIVQADVSGQTLQLTSATAFTNNGLMRATGGGTLLFNNSTDVINNATIRSENGSTVNIQSTRIIGGTLDNTGSTGIMTISSGTLRDVTIASGSAVTNVVAAHLENSVINKGTLSPGNGQSIRLTANTTLSGSGSIPLGFGYIYADASNLTLTNTNNIVRGYGQIGFNANNFSFINESGGIVQADVSGQTLTLNDTGSFTNNGLFAARNGGTLLRSNNSTFTNFSGSTLAGGAYLAADSTLNLNIGPVVFNAATVVLSGPASVFTAVNSIGQNDGTFVITNGRTFGATPPQPDFPAGVFANPGTLILGPNDSSFSVTGDYAQGSGSTLEIVIGADYPSASFHHLNVSGSASLAGTLEVKLANGYVPAPNQMFEIIHAGAINGGFVTVNGATVTYTATGVFINATGNTNALQLTKAVSRKTHGPAGALDINLPLTGTPGVECRSSGGNHTLVFTFSNNLVSGNATRTSGVGTVTGSPTFAGKTMTVNLTGVADAQLVTLTLRGLTDVFSQVLPDQTVTMGVLLGDTTGNSAVSSSDVSQTKSQTGITVTAANARQDVTVNGAITSSDVSLVKSRSGSAIP